MGRDGLGWPRLPSLGRKESRTCQAKKEVKRYDIVWATLEPTSGAEMSKTRPVVIVSLDELTKRLQTVTVCPITSQVHPPWRCRMQIKLKRRRSRRPSAAYHRDVRRVNGSEAAQPLLPFTRAAHFLSIIKP